MIQDFFNQIEHPANCFRGAPFWAWNGKLDPAELKHQISKMKQMGMGGFFMHSRVGLATPYLGREWFEAVRTCIAEAKKFNMGAWLYDEDRWPSGFAGGLVTREHPEYRRSYLKYEFLDIPVYQETDLAWFAGRKSENESATNNTSGELHAIRRLKKGEKIGNGEIFLRFYVAIDPDSAEYNGGSYADTCNPEAIRKFIEVTHEKYATEISAEFGKSVPGIFTDEPQHSNWTPRLPDEIQKRFGYDLLDFLPELFFNVNGQECSRVRLHYYDVMTDLFVKSFAKQIGEWCEAHNILFTGHVLAENEAVTQSTYIGSTMRFYEYMQSPGIDLLTEHWTVYDAAKQCASVAHQFDRKFRLAELYGCTGWDFPFMGHKALGDWLAALGVPGRSQHLIWYSMEGEAKRDYPASIGWQSPWYKDYQVVENYFARLTAALSEGEEVRELLVIHPIESTWFGKAIPSMTEEEMKCEDRRLVALRSALLKDNLDFDYGDEEIMSRHAKLHGKMLSIGKAEYRAVVLPRMRTVRSTTLNLLSEFSNCGGVVVYVGDIPLYENGEKSSRIARIYQKFISADESSLAEKIAPSVRKISITASGKEIDPVLYSIHKASDFETLFICNTGMEQSVFQRDAQLVRERTLTFPQVQICWETQYKHICELDLETGKRFPVKTEYENGYIKFETSLEQLQSRFFISSAAEQENATRMEPATHLKSIALTENSWIVTPDEPNVMVLDHASYSVNNQFFSIPAYILKIDEHLRKLLGKEPRGGLMYQPWCNSAETPEKTLDVVLKYTFSCDIVPEKLFIAVEHPELYSYLLNGENFEFNDEGYWCDRAIRKHRLPTQLLQNGENILELHCTAYHELLPGLEAIYLLGDFGVKNDVLTKQPEFLNIGDWCNQGFPHYSGNLIYKTNLDKPCTDGPVLLSFPEWRGIGLAVTVNGYKRKVIAWPPFTLDISEFLQEKNNTIEIEVLGHRRNSMGPFYTKEKWPYWTGPIQFATYQVTEKQLVPCGLLAAPIISFEI